MNITLLAKKVGVGKSTVCILLYEAFRQAGKAVFFVRSRTAQATARLTFNKVRKATVLGRLVDESAKQVSVPSLPVMLSDRECYKHSIAQGWKALDHAAREEVLQFTVAL